MKPNIWLDSESMGIKYWFCGRNSRKGSIKEKGYIGFGLTPQQAYYNWERLKVGH